MANETKKLRLRRGDLKVLESWVRSRTLPRRQVERAQMLLAASHGESSRSIAEALGVARDTARLWIRRYGEGGLKSVAKDRERAGRPRKLTPALEEEIVAKTVSEKPPPEKSTHWSSRLLADEMGLNHVDVWRTWSKFGLKPHKVRRFKLSRDPRLVEKLNDVVGVYLNPPDNAVASRLRREEPDPGPGPYSAGAATETGPRRHHDARLQAPWHNDAFRRS